MVDGFIPSGKLSHNYGKSPCSMGKSTINGPFSIVILNYQRVTCHGPQFGMIPEMAMVHMWAMTFTFLKSGATTWRTTGPAVVVGGRAYGWVNGKIFFDVEILEQSSSVHLLVPENHVGSIGYRIHGSPFSSCSLITNRRAANLEQPLGL